MRGAAIAIDAVSKEYGGHHVVRGVSLDVAAGEFVALLGPSGSGKTTILMSVAGFVRPTAGAIRIDGRDVTDLPPRLRNIGMVFQRYALFPHMTVGQNIAFPLVQRGLGRAEVAGRVADMAALVGLGGFEARSVTNLSGGQQQRVALARALVFRPPVLLMDEPLGALDKKLRERLQVEIKDIQHATGTTVLFVTHDQAEALSMADKLVVLNHGLVEQVGTPAELYDAPASVFVADFIGEANILRGALVDVGAERCRLRLSDGSEVGGLPVGALGGDGHGRPVELVVRPSSVRLAASPADGLAAQVLSTTYLGDSMSVRLRLGSGEVVTAKEPPAVARAAPGEILHVSWPVASARVFRSDHRGALV